MHNFSTSKRHIMTQGLLLLCLIVFTLQPENFNVLLRVPILLIIDIIVAVFFLSSFMRKVTFNGEKLIVKSMWKTTAIDTKNIDYVQVLSAFARWVMIINDGKHTVIITSLVGGIDKIADIIRSEVSDELKEKMKAISTSSVSSKKLTYDSVMIMLSGIVCYGIIRNILNI